MSQDLKMSEGEVVVLTGAAGCLGFHTIMLLIEEIEQCKVSEVRCLDLVEPSDYFRRAFDQALEHDNRRVQRGQFKWILGDIRDINVVERVLEGADCVIHCAAKVDIWTKIEEQDEEELNSINIQGTRNLLEASCRLGVPKFIHVSSFEVYASHDTIYYATETTLPDTKRFLFGPSAKSKKEAEALVRQFSNNKLQQTKPKARDQGKDFLNAIIVRFPIMYGELDKYFVSKILEMTKHFGGSLRRLDNIWIRHQPIYARNAAWALLKARERMDKDRSISGEEFHITDETTIGDPFDFVAPYLHCKGMQVTERSYPYLPLLGILMLYLTLKRTLRSLDFLGFFTTKKSRLGEAMELDKSNAQTGTIKLSKKSHWTDYFTPQILAFLCNSCFLNRTKASLRLDYEPIVGPDEAQERSIAWYKDYVRIDS